MVRKSHGRSLKQPDLLDVDVTIKRTQLANEAGVFEMAIEAAEIIKAKLMNTSTRLMEAFCKGALTLQKLQMGASQIVTVQHVQIKGVQVIIGNMGH